MRSTKPVEFDFLRKASAAGLLAEPWKGIGMHGRLPSMRGIEAFIAAADTLSFRIASERLNVTVSAISHRIHVLEQEIGVPLFDRKGRAIRLTAAGLDYRGRLRPLFDELREATAAVHSASSSSVVRIASFQFFHEHWLAPRLPRFLTKYPDAQIEMMTLRRRRSSHPDINVRIVRPADVGRDDELLFKWDLSPVCRPELVETYRIRAPVDLLKVRLIESPTAPEVWPRWFAAADVDADLPRQTLCADSPALTVELAAAGAGVAMMATFQTLYRKGRGLVQPFKLTCNFPGGVYIDRAPPSERPVVVAFRAWLLKEVATTVKGSSAED